MCHTSVARTHHPLLRIHLGPSFRSCYIRYLDASTFRHLSPDPANALPGQPTPARRSWSYDVVVGSDSLFLSSPPVFSSSAPVVSTRSLPPQGARSTPRFAARGDLDSLWDERLCQFSSASELDDGRYLTCRRSKPAVERRWTFREQCQRWTTEQA